MIGILKIFVWEPVQSYFGTKEQKSLILLAWGFIKESGATSTEIIYCFTQKKGLEFNIDGGALNLVLTGDLVLTSGELSWLYGLHRHNANLSP